MPREGTRSATGNSKPRVFPVVDTAPAVKRTAKPKKAAPAPKAKAAKPVGVTKKKAPAKKEGVAKKVRTADATCASIRALWVPCRGTYLALDIYSLLCEL